MKYKYYPGMILHFNAKNPAWTIYEGIYVVINFRLKRYKNTPPIPEIICVRFGPLNMHEVKQIPVQENSEIEQLWEEVNLLYLPFILRTYDHEKVKFKMIERLQKAPSMKVIKKLLPKYNIQLKKLTRGVKYEKNSFRGRNPQTGPKIEN